MVYCKLMEMIVAQERKERRDITICDVAEETGISIKTLRLLKSYDGVKMIDVEAIEMLCVYFDCKVSDLLVWVRDEKEDRQRQKQIRSLKQNMNKN